MGNARSMKAARLVGPRRFEFLETAVPAAEDGQCLVKLEQLSICGSDIHREFGRLFPEDHYPVRIGAPCHELAGVVAESRTDEFSEGQRVIVYPGITGPGGLVEFIASDPGMMCALPEEGGLAEWVICQPAGTVLYACEKLGSLVGKSIAIVGQGAIGLSFSMIASSFGAAQVIGVDPLDYRLKWSQDVGATHTVNPDAENVVQTIQDITEGRGPDVVVEAVGSPEALNTALRLVRPFGMVVVFGIQSTPLVPIEHELLMERQPTIIATRGGFAQDPIAPVRAMVDLKRRGIIDPGRLVTHRLPFDEIQRAYEIYEAHDDEVIKVVIDV